MDQHVKLRPVEYRQATAAQMAAENPVVPLGQLVREKDKNRYKLGDGITAYASLPYVVDATPPVAKAGVTGATSLDASEGGVFFLSLTGNVTGFTFTNLVAGAVYEVHFIQDATGSRTLAVNATVVKLAGGALTLTTTASKRDVLRFRAISTSAVVEIGRSLNI